MGVFDDAEHEAIELDPAGFVAWLLAGLDSDLAYNGWLETQAAATTHQREKRADVVAELRSRSGSQPPWACLVEVQAQPYADMLLRVLEHLARLGQQLRHGPHGQDRYLMMAGVVNLTESRLADTLELLPPTEAKEGEAEKEGRPRGLVCRVWVRDVLFESAVEMLKDVEEKQTAPCLLAWGSLMQGADAPALIAEWKRLAMLEPDAAKRGSYGALALVFADLVGRKEVWEKELEGWNVQESYFVNKWKAEERQKTLRGAVRSVLTSRGIDPIPPEINAALDGQGNPDVLDVWLKGAVTAATASDFLDFMQKHGSNGS